MRAWIEVEFVNFGRSLLQMLDATSQSRATKQSGRPLLNHRQQQQPSHGDDRERITSARQAAEALFTPKAAPVGPSPSEPAPSAAQPPRKPRVLPVSSPAPARNEEVAAPIDPEPRTTRQIPRSHLRQR
jgi:hypothetical protein